MKLQPPISDDDIEALLSDSLPPRRRRVVEDHLAGNPDLRARVDALRADQEVLRALGADLLDEPIPDRFLRLLSAEEVGEEAGGEDDPSGDAALQRAEDPPRRRCLGT